MAVVHSTGGRIQTGKTQDIAISDYVVEIDCAANATGTCKRIAPIIGFETVGNLSAESQR